MGHYPVSLEACSETTLATATSTLWHAAAKRRLTLLGCEIVEDIQTSGFLTINQDKKTVTWRGRPVHLTASEYKILCLLTQRAGVCLTYREVYDVVRGPGFFVGDGPNGHRNAARTHVKRIRNKLRDIDESFDQIETRPGFGYLWRAIEHRQLQAA